MKTLIALVINSLFLQVLTAQKTEYSVGVNGTGSNFRGKSSSSGSSILISDTPPSIPNYTTNAYGKQVGFGGNIEFTLQHLGKKRFIKGVTAGYESITARVKIIEAGQRLNVPADGTTRMTHTFINFFPYIGKRFNLSKCKLDVNAGADIALPLSAHEKGKATPVDGSIVTTDADRSKPSIDIRPRLQLKFQKNHFGLQSSFSLGLTNYYDLSYGGDSKAYSNIFRFGVFYVL